MKRIATNVLLGILFTCCLQGEELSVQVVKSEYDLLLRPDVLEELGVSDSQINAMRQSVLRPEVREALNRMNAERPARRDLIDDVYRLRVVGMREPLSPVQLQRLEELRWQYDSLMGFGKALETALKLSEEQKRQLREKEADLGEELQELLRQTHRHSQHELQDLLSDEQKQAWAMKKGQDFEFQSSWPDLTPLSLSIRCPMNAHIPLVVIILLAPFADTLDERQLLDVSDDSELLSRPDVQAELELVDEQLTALKAATEAANRRMAELEAKRGTTPTEELLAEVRAMIAENRRSRHEVRQQVFLPFQLERLEELRWQYRSFSDPVSAFDNALELTDEQVAIMREKEAELREELIKKLRQFHTRAEREILEILTPEQRFEWQKKVGEQMKFQPSDRGLSALNRLR